MIRYYGLYSNAHKGRLRKAGADLFYPRIIEDGLTYLSERNSYLKKRPGYGEDQSDEDHLIASYQELTGRFISLIIIPRKPGATKRLECRRLG